MLREGKLASRCIPACNVWVRSDGGGGSKRQHGHVTAAVVDDDDGHVAGAVAEDGVKGGVGAR